MTGRTLVLLGAGDHAAVVGEAARLAGWPVAGCVADRPSTRGLHVLGDETTAVLPADVALIAAFTGGVGMAPRAQAIARWTARAAAWATIIHPRAVVSPGATLGDGTFVAALALVGPGARVGAHAILNHGAIVEHDVVVGARTHLAPGAVVGGSTTIGAGCWIGLGARIRDHITIGDGAVVGMGAVVTRDVPPGATVVGVPARQVTP
jgi:acetyltransferase EpsM